MGIKQSIFEFSKGMSEAIVIDKQHYHLGDSCREETNWILIGWSVRCDHNPIPNTGNSLGIQIAIPSV